MQKQQVTFLSYEFTASLYMFSNALPSLASLSRAFQRKYVNFTVVRPLLNSTKAAINARLTSPGEHFQTISPYWLTWTDMECKLQVAHKWKDLRELCMINTFRLFLS